MNADLIAIEASLRLRLRELAQQQRDTPERQAARDSLIPFCQWTFPSYEAAPHLVYVAEHLEAVERGEISRLLIEMPPRHGKTELVSIRFPAWLMGRHPVWPIISASYGDLLAHETGRQVRNILRTQSVFDTVWLAQDSQAKNLWHTNHGGKFLSVGIGSGVIGHGGRVILIDDPIKKLSEAMSETVRESHKGWYRSEIITRQEPDAAIVMVLHRWHEDDLAGWRLREDGEVKDGGRWTVLRLPAVAEVDDPLGRSEGTPLWPERYSRDVLRGFEEEVGPREWNALYQQRPRPDEGAIYKWFPRYHELPPVKEIVLGIDTAYTDERHSDYTAWTAWGSDGARAYWLEAGRFKGETPDAERRITQVYWRLWQQYPQARVHGAVRASVAIDRIAAQHLRRGVATLKEGDNGFKEAWASMPVTEVKLPAIGGGQSKVAVSNIVSVEFEGGRALVPYEGENLEAWIEEHKSFPTGLHDHWVETTMVALYHLFRRPLAERPTQAQRWWG